MDAAANVGPMTEAGRAIQSVVVTEAIRDATIGGTKVKRGQTIALDPDDGLVAVDKDRTKCVLKAVRALAPGFELLTLFYGEGAELAEAEAMARSIGTAMPDAEIEVRHGGQPSDRYLISAE
jgi:dihydroxyacetone kinase-like predicted kinase